MRRSAAEDLRRLMQDIIADGINYAASNSASDAYASHRRQAWVKANLETYDWLYTLDDACR
jgi:hypothetical protein